MPPQPRANRPESETGGRITNVPTLARIGFLAGVFRVRRPFGRFLRRVAPKAHRRARPAAEADRVSPKHILALVLRPKPTDPCAPAPVSTPFALPPDALALASMNAMSADAPAIKQAIALVRKHKISQATEIEKSAREPMAQKLIEWVILRSEESGADFGRYVAFIRDNPAWPSLGILRRRAEGTLWQERRDAVTVRRFLNGKPTSATGRLALARVL